MIFTVASRELRSMFLSPLAWTVLAVVCLILGYLFLAQLDLVLQLQPRLALLPTAPGITQLIVTPVFANAAIVLMLVVPLLTMRLVAEERRNLTLPLLFSSPVSMTEIVLGKFFGIMGFFVILLFLIMLMPLSLLMGGTLDWGTLASGLLGLSLLLASFSAAGLYFSTLTSHPVVAAMSTFGFLLLLWLLDWAAGQADTAVADQVIRYISTLKHFEPMVTGVFKSTDLIYYLLFITVFLGLSIRRLDSYRLQH